MDPSSTPTDGQVQIAGLTIRLSWFTRVIRTDQPESAEKLLALLAGFILCLGTLAFIIVAIWQGIHIIDPHNGTVRESVLTGLGLFGGYLLVFAKWIHKDQQPPQGGQS